MDLEVVQTPGRVESLRAEWRDLWESVPEADIFTDLDWISTWWETFGSDVGVGPILTHERGRPIRIPTRAAEFSVYVVRENGHAKVIAPFLRVKSRWKRLPARVLTLPLNDHAPRSGFVVAEPAGAAMAVLASHLARSSNWDILLLDGLPLGSAYLEAFVAEADRNGLATTQDDPWPHSVVRIQGTWEEYFGSRRRHFRKRFNRSRRALEELGRVTIGCYGDGVSVQDGLEKLMEVDAASWKAMGGESIALEPSLRSHYGTLASRFAARKGTEVWILSIDGEPASATLCLRDRSWLYACKTSYKEKFGSAHLSPSTILMGHILERAWAKRLEGVDFLANTPFARKWGKESVQCRRILVFNKHPYARFLAWWHSFVSRVVTRPPTGSRGDPVELDEEHE